jgi:hypothetical protein
LIVAIRATLPADNLPTKLHPLIDPTSVELLPPTNSGTKATAKESAIKCALTHRQFQGRLYSNHPKIESTKRWIQLAHPTVMPANNKNPPSLTINHCSSALLF